MKRLPSAPFLTAGFFTKTSMSLTILLLILSVATLAAAKRPNIVLILVDDMGWSDIGCYGAEIQTPNLDTLAAQGIRFRNFYNTSKCFPTRACLLSGVYAQQNGYDSDAKSTFQNAVTIGEVLGKAGYHTFASGKHHGGDNLYDLGFDRYYGLRDGVCNHFNPGLQREGEADPARKLDNRQWADDGDVFEARDEDYQHYFPAEFYTTDAFTAKALEYIDEWHTQNTGRPFLLYLAYTAPHDPLMAWPSDIAKYEGVYEVGYEPIRAARYQKQVDIGLLEPATHPLSAATYQNWNSLSADAKADQARRMQVYAAMVDRVDQKIGEIITKLQEVGAYEDTLILFCSDNGSSPGDNNRGDLTAEIGGLERYASLQRHWANVGNTPFRYAKTDSYNGGIQTPLIAHWPNGIANPGRFADKAGHMIDFMATFIDLAQADYPRFYQGSPVTPLQGESFVDVLYDQPLTPRSALYFRWSSGRAIIEGSHKLVTKNNGGSWQLYDLRNDATETSDLSGSRPGLKNELLAKFNVWQTRVQENLLPTAQDDTFAGSMSDFVDVDVLNNDTDPDGTIDPSTLRLTRSPLFGTATIQTDNRVRYTAGGAMVQRDVFGYQVTDNDGEISNEALVTIDLSGLPDEYRIEAEDATLSGANVSTNKPSASGGAHVNYNPNDPADYVEWTLEVARDGGYDFIIGYALESGTRRLDLTVNGNLIEEDMAFSATGSWSSFGEKMVSGLALVGGANTIRLATNTNSDGPNLDYLLLRSQATTVSDQDSDGLPDWLEEGVQGLDPQDPSDALEDLDGDGESNLLESRANTDLTDPNSTLGFRLQGALGNEMLIEWKSLPGIRYEVFQSPDLSQWTKEAAITPETTAGRYWIPTEEEAQYFRLQFE
jgi:arylsulfatase A-like enzyme